MSNQYLLKDQEPYTQWGGDEGIIWKKNEPKEDIGDDYDADNGSFIPNNKEFEGIDDGFKQKLINTKHVIYEQSILKPDENSTESQNIDLVELYQTYIKMFYILMLQSEKNTPIMRSSIALFPAPVIPLIQDSLNWISSFFSKNTPRETLPYSHYIKMHLHTNPFFQDDLFISNKNRK